MDKGRLATRESLIVVAASSAAYRSMLSDDVGDSRGSGADGVGDLCSQLVGGVPESRKDIIT